MVLSPGLSNLVMLSPIIVELSGTYLNHHHPSIAVLVMSICSVIAKCQLVACSHIGLVTNNNDHNSHDNSIDARYDCHRVSISLDST